MRNLFLLSVVLFVFLGCVNQEDFNIDRSILYQPYFSIPLGKPEIILEDFVGELEALQTVPDSLVNDTTVFFYDNNYCKIPRILTYEYFKDFSINSLTNEVDQIVSLMFRTNVSNSIPGVILVQYYFANSDMSYIDSLYRNGPLVIESALVDTAGIVVQNFILQEDTYLDQEMINSLSNTSFIVFSCSLSLVNEQGVFSRYYSTQDIGIQLGARLGLEIDAN